MQQLFVTGYLRSGTTLLEKVLHAHPSLCVGAQPFPVLYYAAKEAFLADIGVAPADYPLGHLFQNRAYGPEDFTAFLERWTCSDAELDRVFERLSEYSGWKTRELGVIRPRLRAGGFGGLFRQLVEALPEIYGKSDATHAGAKEVFCEEFIPFLLGHDVRVVLIVRDPRDVVASMNFGGEAHVGPVTPTLYALRQWRKSVAFALAYRRDPGFHLLRYEHLVEAPGPSLEALTRFLGVDPYPPEPFAEGLRDQWGRPWRGNSSFRSHPAIDPGSIGAHRRALPAACTRYIESLCHPELRALGYPLDPGAGCLDRATLAAFREPVVPTRPGIPADYSTIPEEIDREMARIQQLRSGLDDPDEIAAGFIRREAFECLRP